MIPDAIAAVRRGHLPRSKLRPAPCAWYRLVFGWIAAAAIGGCVDRLPPTGKSDVPPATTPDPTAAQPPATTPPGGETTDKPPASASANWKPLNPDDPATRVAQAFLKAFGEGVPAAELLSDRLLKHLGRPWELPDDRTRGYSRLNAESLLRRWGSGRNFGLPTGAGDARVAVVHGEFRTPMQQGHYVLRLVADGGDWKVDGLCLSSAAWPQEPRGSDAAAAMGAATAKMLGAVLCDRAALPSEDRALLLADLLSAELRQKFAPPFESDRTSGFDFNRGQLRLKLDELAAGATTYRVEVASPPQQWRLILLHQDRPHAVWELSLAADGPAAPWHIHRLTPQPQPK